MAKINDIIASAIKDADTSYFSEDYSKQAANVTKMLSQSGYVIVPKEPDDTMIAAGKQAIAFGASKPAELIKAIYAAMLASTSK